ncbi:MAG: tetratricopeptide repeat protein [Candidatus Hodarchaeota archaeon]
MELISKLPKGYPGLEKLIKKNYKKIDIEKLKFVAPNLKKPQIEQLFKQIIKDVFPSNPNALEVLKTLLVINMEIDTNIDGGSIETCCEFPNIEKSLQLIIDAGIIKKKLNKQVKYKFFFQEIQDNLEFLAEERHHKNAIKYYEKKVRRFKDNVQDQIELLFHKAKVEPSAELVNEFLAIANNIPQFEYEHKRLIDVAQELFILEDEYKAPILNVVGNLFSAIGNSEDAEKIYLNALEIYENLAQKYYKIYLPYIASTQKYLGSLYTDLKRFEEAEKIYSDALRSYKELKKLYYNAHSTEFHKRDELWPDKSYIDDLKAYNELLSRYYDVFLPEEPSTSSNFGNVGIDLDLLEDIQNGSIDSIETYKKLSKIYYDLYLIDIAKTQSNLGLIYTELNKYKEAEKRHLKALKIKKEIAEHHPEQILPELVLTLLDLGDLYASLNRFEEAEPMFKDALYISKQLAEQNPEIYFQNVAFIQNSLGNLYTRLQKFEEAEKVYLEALEIFKALTKQDYENYSYNVANVQNNLANIYLNLNNLEKAESYLTKAYKKDPTNIEVLYNMLCLESLRNNKIKALELLKKVLSEDKNYMERAKEDKKLDKIKGSKEFKELIDEID